MIKTINIRNLSLILSLIIITFGVMSCGGGGAGSLSPIPGENPGVPSVVELAPSSFIAQTNGFITFSAKVLDGNGKPISNQNVTFTNLSSIGVLQGTTAITDSTGIARVNLSSTTPGFATVLAQVYTGAGQVRDRKTVFFTTKDILNVTMDMDVNSVPGNIVYNELSDYTLFENDSDDTVEVLVTVRDAGGVPVGGGWSVFWSRSHTEATLDRTEDATNDNGQSKAIVKVTPSTIRNTETHVNIMAYAENGAANIITLFLRPVVPDPARSSVTATPTTVEVGGTSTITAVVITNLGSPAPNGTIVNFTATCGRLSSFAPIASGGIATTTFTAPNSPGTCTITGKVAGITIGSAAITVRAMRLTPSTATICENTAPCGPGNSVASTTQAFTINGGVAPYIVTSSHPTAIPSPGTLASSSFTVDAINDLIVNPTTTVTLSVEDSGGNTATATVTVINQ